MSRRADMFIDLKDDPRENGPRHPVSTSPASIPMALARRKGRCHCARCWSDRSMSTRATSVTPTCCVSGSTDA
jgi:hypothetical protein